MDVDALRASPIGTLVPIRGYDHRRREDYDHYAYLPAPLPATILLARQAYLSAAAATAAVARLDQTVKQLPDPGIVIRPSLTREAVSTSALEGTFATLSQVYEAEVLRDGKVSGSVAEVNNYVRAAEAAYDWVVDRPITVSLLEQLQKVLVSGTTADTPESGSVRTSQVFIGVTGGRVADARFVPPPPGDQLRAGLESWQEWINASDDELTLVKAALGHYQFETLHPFNDGNGRLGRLVAVLQLMRSGELSYPALDLSPWLEERQEQYRDHLYEVSRTGRYDRWVQFFCEAARSRAVAAVERLDALLAWRQNTVDRLRAAKVSGIALVIAEELIGNPVVSVGSVERRYGVSYQAASNAVRRLEEHRVLREFTGRSYGRIYEAPEVLKIIGD